MGNDKLKIIYLMQLLYDKTDSEHPMTQPELCEKIRDHFNDTYGRQTFYRDIATLQEVGMRIVVLKGNTFGYYVDKRDFDLAELKLLVDAVQSSKFITMKKSELLIKKLEHLTSCHNATQLQRQVYIYNRIKTENDAIYNNIDTIHFAIQNNRKISFKYCEWTPEKTLVRKRNGDDYIVSPWALTWDDENYYLVGYEPDTILHYRVDKMQEIKALKEERIGKESFEGFDLADYARKTFGMFRGKDKLLTLEGEACMAGVIIDRFGRDVMMRRIGDDRFQAHVTVTVSSQFFGWLAGLGGKVTISTPENIREKYKEFLKELMENM